MHLLYRGTSTGAITFVLRLKIGDDLQLFSDWLINIFNYFTCKGWEFQRFQIYVMEILLNDASAAAIWFTISFKMADLQLCFDWLIYVFHYLTCKEYNVFKYTKILTISIYIFETPLPVLSHSLCDSKYPQFGYLCKLLPWWGILIIVLTIYLLLLSWYLNLYKIHCIILGSLLI